LGKATGSGKNETRGNYTLISILLAGFFMPCGVSARPSKDGAAERAPLAPKNHA